MESQQVILPDEVISQIKSNVTKLIDFLGLHGYQIVEDWKFSRDTLFGLNSHNLHITLEKLEPKMECLISAYFRTKESDWHWSIRLSLYPYDADSKSYSFNEVSNLDLVLEKYHPDRNRSFIQFPHSDDLQTLSKSADQSVQTWIQVLSHELKQDITGDKLRMVKHALYDEYW